jgi:hypothetical protein
LAKQDDVSELKAEIIIYKEANAESAMQEGALRNIAENNATPIDVAKVMKDSDITIEDMQEYGIAPKSKIAKDGFALSQLENWLFIQVATRAFPIERGTIIGRELGDNKAAQRQIVRELGKMESKGKTVTNDVLSELIAQAKGTAQVSFKEQTLFGEELFTKDLAVERAEVVSYVKGQLKNRVSVLKNVSKEKNANLLEELGNKIVIDDNVKGMSVAEQALYIMDKTLNYQGTKTNEIFNKYAKLYAEAEPKDRVSIKKEALNEYIKAMEGGNLLNEAITSEGKRSNAKKGIISSRANGEGRQESGIDLQTAREETAQNQVDLFGEDTVNQLKKNNAVEVVVSPNTDEATKKELMPAIDTMKNNVFFNGLKVEFSGKESVQYYTKEELKKYGYEGYEAGYYEISGSYEPGRIRSIQGINEESGSGGIRKRGSNNGDNSISSEEAPRGRIKINNGAKRDTILHEVIHFINWTFT